MSRPIVCDQCGRHLKRQEWWLTPPRAGVDPYVDLCSVGCVLAWASRKLQDDELSILEWQDFESRQEHLRRMDAVKQFCDEQRDL